MRLLRFTLIAAVGWCLDFSLFYASILAGLPILIANPLGALGGIAFSFFGSKRSVFYSNSHFLSNKFIIYLLYSCVAVFIFSKMIQLLFHFGIPIALAKILTTPVSFLANFFALGIILHERKNPSLHPRV